MVSGLSSEAAKWRSERGPAGGWFMPGFEAPALVIGFEDLAVMRQAVEQCGRHLRILRNAGPFTEFQIVVTMVEGKQIWKDNFLE
jgi:hypothetical protein